MDSTISTAFLTDVYKIGTAANIESENGKNEMTKRQMQGCELLEIEGVGPKRALLELRDGKFWDGEPATRKEDGTTSMLDGFYFVELTSDGTIPMLDGFHFVELTGDGKHILGNYLYGPYADAVEAEIAAWENYTLTDFNRAMTELERKGRIRRVVGEDGVPRYHAIGPLC
jgi:hypothetical protein